MMIQRGAHDDDQARASARSRSTNTWRASCRTRHRRRGRRDRRRGRNRRRPGAGPARSAASRPPTLIRQAREDDDVKAVVLRVDSPGGSAFGSELIRRELELTRAAGKPVVVSMGDVAASGGYWISMASDEIIADPSHRHRLDRRVRHAADGRQGGSTSSACTPAGVTTTWLADAYNPLRPLDPRFGQLIQASIDHIYAEFTSQGRRRRARRRRQKIDAVGAGPGLDRRAGQGTRPGRPARQLRRREAAAAARAGLATGYRMAWIERDPGRWARVLTMFDSRARPRARRAPRLALGGGAGLAPQVAREIGADLGWLGALADRRGRSAPSRIACAPRLDPGGDAPAGSRRGGGRRSAQDVEQGLGADQVGRAQALVEGAIGRGQELDRARRLVIGRPETRQARRGAQLEAGGACCVRAIRIAGARKHILGPDPARRSGSSSQRQLALDARGLGGVAGVAGVRTPAGRSIRPAPHGRGPGRPAASSISARQVHPAGRADDVPRPADLPRRAHRRRAAATPAVAASRDRA